MNKSIENFIGLINQLIVHLNQLRELSYSEKLSIFGGATIGEHVRHIYNFPQCLLKGVQTGTVNYDKRVRDTNIELNRDYAVSSLLTQANYILNLEHYEHIPLLLETGADDETFSRMNTNLKRELHYITEHTIHHMAILRLGFNFHFPEIEIDGSFGFAYSTLAYKEKSKISQ
jgi:hypothetical protein